LGVSPALVGQHQQQHRLPLCCLGAVKLCSYMDNYLDVSVPGATAQQQQQQQQQKHS
jgi:hypothetical protein